MIKAYFRKTADTFEMRVQGHAGFGEAGKDPVCAGASVLALTVAECVDALSRGGAAVKAPIVHINKPAGNVRVTVRPTPEGYEKIRSAFLFGQVGFGLLSEAYPEHVQLTLFDTAPGDREGKQESGAESINTTESST